MSPRMNKTPCLKIRKRHKTVTKMPRRVYQGLRHCTARKQGKGGRMVCAEYAAGRGPRKRHYGEAKYKRVYSNARYAACHKGKSSAMAAAWDHAIMAGHSNYLTGADIRWGWKNCGM